MMWAYLLIVVGVVSLLVTLVVRTTVVANRQAAAPGRPTLAALTGLYLLALVVLIGGVCSFLWLGAGWHMGC
ncbi:hypothetical protein [Levilactobacillus acidifarinae]|nr:hypothetical protein [Levilactobacillus acidifarinae]GEO69404.1 hypothetical protein LAC03_13140 [Levilactobacillus acidifarinae]